MTWVDAVASAVLVALLVRVDAVVIGPYWALVELIQIDDIPAPRVRRHAIWRRGIYAALVGAGLVVIRPESSVLDAAWVGLLGAGLLLWPMVFHGLPLELVRYRSALVALYVAFVTAFFAAGYLGGLVATWFLEDVVEAGGLWAFLRDQSFEFVIALVVWTVMSTIAERRAAKVEGKVLGP